MDSTVCLDLGASGTRFIRNSENQTNDFDINNIEAKMVEVGKHEVINMKPSSNSILDALDVSISKDGDTSENKNYYEHVLIGDMAMRYSNSVTRPSGLTAKVSQKINYTSAIVATALCFFNEVATDCGDVDVFVALPPVEVKRMSETFKNNLVGRYSVLFNKVNKLIMFNIRNVYCFAESQAAVVSYLFNTNGTLTEAAKKYKDGCILSIDIGASTTDLVVVENLRYNERSGQTYKIGGNVCIDSITDAVQEEYGLYVDQDTAEEILKTGHMRFGNSFKDVREMVKEAKKKYAKEVVNELQVYFRKVGMPIQNMRAIVVSGGGALTSSYTNGNETVITTAPMSEYITEALKEVCDGIDVVTVSGNTRFANITGVGILSKFVKSK